ncbi:MAG TPA: carboxypeptidase regulatory-like domain-containing protein [Thermoanaerobaculia bacterium]|nr:carboxypeptidase regulatory-like domain-containing protein [Thermoanaerobaculia bacterium]
MRKSGLPLLKRDRLAALTAALALAPLGPAAALPVSGRVLGPGGSPVQGARTELVRQGESTDPAPVVAATTDRDGRFSLEAPGPGLWRVAVRSPGYVSVEAPLQPLLYGIQLPPAILQLDTSQRVAVADREGRPLEGALVRATPSQDVDQHAVWVPAERVAKAGPDGTAVLQRAEGEILEVRARSPLHAESAPVRGHGRMLLIRLDPARKNLTEATRTIRLRGRVVDAATNRPIGNALAWVEGRGNAVFTTPDGAFEVTASGPGRLLLAAPGYVLASLDARTLPPEVRLQPAASVEGRVVDPSGRPVADARILVDPPLPSDPPVASAPDGRFRLDGLPPASALALSARLEHPGRPPGPVSAASPLSPLAPGESRKGVRLVLARGAAVSGAVVAVEGRKESAAAGARVRLQPLRAGSPAVEVTTGQDGRFLLADLPEGRYRLDVRKPDLPAPVLPEVVVSETLRDLDLGRIVLPRGVTLAGVVTDPEGRPIPGAEVRATLPGRESAPEDPPIRATTRDDGGFRLGGLREGEPIDLRAEHPDYAPAEIAGVEAAPDPAVSIVLAPGAWLSGQVVDEDGEGVAGAVLAAWVSPAPGSGARGVDGLQVAAAADGHFEIRGLPPGTLRLRASAPGHQEAEVSGLELQPLEPLDDVRLVLAPSAVLEGTVRNSQGAPVPRARIAVRPAVDGPENGTRTVADRQVDAEGRFRVDGLAPGAVLVLADHDRYRQMERPFDLHPGVNRIDLVLETGLAVAGRVLDEAGTPVAGALVRLTEAGADRASARSRADGSFRLTGLSAGRLSIEASREGFSPAHLVVELAEAPVEGIELRLERGVILEGRILGLEAGDLARVKVSAFSPDFGVRTGTVGGDGRYRIEGLPPGDWMAIASVPPGSRQAKAPVRVAASASPAVADLDFRQGLTLSGRILLDGAPLADVRVEAIGTAGQGGGAAVTDERGEIRISGLEPGQYRLVLSHPARGLADERKVELPQRAALEISLTPAPLSPDLH